MLLSSANSLQVILGFFAISTVVATPVQSRNTCSAVGISPSDKSKVINAFKQSKIIPDLLSSINPTVKVSVSYGTKQVNLGNTFSQLGNIIYHTTSFNKHHHLH